MCIKVKKNNSMKVMREVVAYLFSEIWTYKPVCFFHYFLDVLFRSVQPFISIIGTKYLIDELLENRDLEKIVIILTCMITATLIVDAVIAYVQECITVTYNNDFSKYFEARLGYKIMQLDFENTENKIMLERAERAKSGMTAYSGGMGGIVKSISEIITGIIVAIGSVSIIMLNVPLLLVFIIILLIANAFYNKKANGIQIKYFDVLTELNRGLNYFLMTLPRFKFGKDLRLYNVGELMNEKADEYIDRTADNWREQDGAVSKYVIATNVSGVLKDCASYLYLGFLVIRKHISVGSFTMLLSASATFSNALNNIVGQFLELHKKSSYIYEYVDFMKLENCGSRGKEKCDSDNNTIEFRNVSFAYPGSDTYAIEKVSITIASGEHLSIVGLNGAGKTTFIKLICRLYDVTEGEILLNGRNIQEYDYKEYINLLSVVFQDIRLVPFSIKENICLQDSVNVKDDELNEIIDKVGLSKMITSLPCGLSTPLFKDYDKDGVEPSGGEQQKIAIARALYKDANIVILDEPTAALDPIAEYEIYCKFDELTKGKTAIYISHRLSSCQFCDRIAVFENGKIVEYGKHDELIQNQMGLYRSMYMAQSQYYNDSIAG